MPGITATENKLFEFRALYGAHSIFKRESTFFPFLVNTKNWEEMEGGLLQCTMYFKHSTAVYIARGIESSHSTVYCRGMLGKRTWTLDSSEKSISELHPPVLQTKSTEKTTILVCYYFLLSLCWFLTARYGCCRKTGLILLMLSRNYWTYSAAFLQSGTCHLVSISQPRAASAKQGRVQSRSIEATQLVWISSPMRYSCSGSFLYPSHLIS